MPLELRTVIPHFMAHIVKMKVRETSPIIAQERENLVFSFRTKIVIFRHQISSWLKTSLSEWWQTHLLDIPCGLVARIRRSHRRGRGSIPRTGDSNFASPEQCPGEDFGRQLTFGQITTWPCAQKGKGSCWNSCHFIDRFLDHSMMLIYDAFQLSTLFSLLEWLD